jgi:hypothetical protein
MTLSVELAASAVALSAVIDFERQWRNRLAGLRTNTLVALGAASFVVFEALVPGETSPTRVAAQVVAGIGFLGAGLILREGLSVRGLNTAATLWCSAAVGVLAGSNPAPTPRPLTAPRLGVLLHFRHARGSPSPGARSARLGPIGRAPGRPGYAAASSAIGIVITPRSMTKADASSGEKTRVTLLALM